MSNLSGYDTNYASFQWTLGQWNLLDNCCDYGCVPVEPLPAGTYEGEVVLTQCQPTPREMLIT